MKYTTEIIVALPLTEFIKKLNNAENMIHWQKGLTGFEHVSGIPGKLGSKLKLNYLIGKKEMELIKTITLTNLPHEIHLTYDTNGMQNMQKNYFTETKEGHTKWISKNEFLATSLKLQIITLLMPKAFKKQTNQYLVDFKNFAENGISINHA